MAGINNDLSRILANQLPKPTNTPSFKVDAPKAQALAGSNNATASLNTKLPVSSFTNPNINSTTSINVGNLVQNGIGSGAIAIVIPNGKTANAAKIT